MKVIAGCFALLLAAGLLVQSVAAAVHGASVPKVVVIVGPAASATPWYRPDELQAAAVDRQHRPDGTEGLSPDAPWPRFKTALQGATLVIYMGHRNGWHSPYRDALYPPTQDGFWLNPTVGSGD